MAIKPKNVKCKFENLKVMEALNEGVFGVDSSSKK